MRGPPPQSNSSSESPTAALSSSSFQMNMSGQKGVDGVECAQITNPERYCHSHHQPHLTGVGSGRLVEANQVIITNSDDAYRAINVDDCQSVIGNENNESDGVFLPVGREIASETVKGQATSQPGSSSSMTLKRKKRREDDAITLMPGLVGDERSGVGEGGGEVYFRMKAADETKESDATRNEGAVNYGEIGVTAASTANDVGASVANNNDELAKEVAVAAAVEQRIEVADNAVTVSILDYSDGGYCNEDGVPSASKGIRGNDIIDADGDIFDNDDVGEIRGDEVGHVRDDGTKAASTAGETPGAKSRGVEVIEVIEVNDDDDDSVHWRINVEDNVEEDDDNVRSMNRDHRKIIVPPRMDASSIDNPTNTTILAAVGVESCTTEGEGDGRSDEPNGNLTDCEIAPEEGRTEEQRVKGTIESDKEEGKVMAEEQRVKCDIERGEEGGKAGKIIRRSATSTSAFRHSVPADSESNTERGNQREGIERMNILPDEHTDALRTTVADFVLHFHNLLKGDKSRSDVYQLMELLKVNIPIISAIVPTTIDEMTKLGLEFTSSTKSKKRWKWMNLLINALLERINSFIESRKLAHHLKAKTRWPSDYWRQYQFELPREESNPLTSAPVIGQLRHTMPVVPNKRARCNIGIDAGAAHNPSSTLCANSGSTGDPSQNYRENQTPARERFSEYRIDNAASIAELESIRRRLLNLVDRVDARLKDMRFAEAMSSIFGKETIDELSTQELMDILSQEIDKSAQAGSCNSTSSDANGRGIMKEALEDAIIRDKAGKRRRYPVTCPLCFDRITSPTLIACEICDEDGICNNCHVNCSSCHRSTCADCLMSCDGCGSSYNCSDCVAQRTSHIGFLDMP
ncbi:hypothetical protein ACHAXA_005179 [Cyclostephanos tholiformis]|uniref:RING-type domain-containing protein n=1 Tax=Cyclostephanos tholiformis TaxID=382380 RepID=A0ABD3RFL0_9STRA